jgi:hypothetical protein
LFENVSFDMAVCSSHKSTYSLQEFEDSKMLLKLIYLYSISPYSHLAFLVVSSVIQLVT